MDRVIEDGYVCFLLQNAASSECGKVRHSSPSTTATMFILDDNALRQLLMHLPVPGLLAMRQVSCFGIRASLRV